MLYIPELACSAPHTLLSNAWMPQMQVKPGQKERHMLLDPHFDADIVHVPRTGPECVSPVGPVTWFGPVGKWTGAWNALIQFIGDVPATLRE
jgi:hypothetical protein